MRILICLAIVALVYGAPIDDAPAEAPAPQEEPVPELEAPIPKPHTEPEQPAVDLEAPHSETPELPAPDVSAPDSPPLDLEAPVPSVPAAENALDLEAPVPSVPAAETALDLESPVPSVPAAEPALEPEAPAKPFSEIQVPEEPAHEEPTTVTLPPHFHHTVPDEHELTAPIEPQIVSPKPETHWIDELMWALFGDDEDDDGDVIEDDISWSQALFSPSSYLVKPIKAEGASVFMIFGD